MSTDNLSVAIPNVIELNELLETHCSKYKDIKNKKIFIKRQTLSDIFPHSNDIKHEDNFLIL